jgi:hypothetical protein
MSRNFPWEFVETFSWERASKLVVDALIRGEILRYTASHMDSYMRRHSDEGYAR